MNGAIDINGKLIGGISGVGTNGNNGSTINRDGPLTISTSRQGMSPADVASSTYFDNGPGSNRGTVDETAIRNNTLAAIQGQIDSTNNTYASLRQNLLRTNEDTTGRTRAIAARSGIIGSDFGNAALDKTSEYNDSKLKALEDERAYKVETILGQANKDAEDRIAKSKETVQKNSLDYINYLKTSADNAVAQLQGLGGAGKSIEDLTTQQLQHYKEVTGYDDSQIKSILALAHPKETVLDKQVSGNMFFQTVQDPITKKISVQSMQLPFTVPQGYKSEKLDNGQVIFYPEKWSGDMSQVKVYNPAPTTTLGNNYKITTSNRNALAGYNFSSPAIDALQKDIQTYGLQAVLDAPRPDAEKKALNDVFGKKSADALSF